MKRINSIMTGRVYAAKRQYPVLTQMEKRINTVKKELNKEDNRR